MKYKQYVVTETRVSHVFVYESDVADFNDTAQLEQEVWNSYGGSWDVVDTDFEYVGEFDENGI